jgi:FAD/FMN-containing dehydrogenase
MNNLKIAKGGGGTATVDNAAIDSLEASLRGQLLREGDEGYDQARSIWNAMIDRKPALIARCSGVADVKTSVDFARTHGLLTAIHGAGHNIAGNAVCEGGLMIDVSELREVRIDPKARRAHVGPGATLGDFDHEAQSFGLATPTGINSTTGVAGLTLGGGFGWLSRKYGMTVDSLTAADVVTADGKFMRASADENEDLFWAVRGGGGNFGVVTRFEFQLYPVGPEVYAGLVVYPQSEAASILRKYREYVSKLGDDTSVWVVLRKAPPLPFLPEEAHGSDVLVFPMLHAGDPEEGKKALEPVRNFGTPLGEHLGVMPYAGWQMAFDALLTPGARNYWKSHNFSELKDEAIDLALSYAAKVPSPQCEIFFAHLGAATTRPASDATAYSHRDAEFVMNVHGRWDSSADDKKCIGWARDFFRETSPFATGGVYINFMTEDETDRVSSGFGSSYNRLVQIKKKYDPNNLFRMNQNISPNGHKA